MRKVIFKGGIVFFLLCGISGLNAQKLTPTDTTRKSVLRYQQLIKQNKSLVGFIENSLNVHGIPEHLRNLAIIESSLERTSVSSAGAQGIWQLMKKHAGQYGLTGKERTDIYKSTQAVMRSLSNLYKNYGNWITVIAAYNCGQGNIQKAMDKAGSKRYIDFEKYLPMETQHHVEKYLNACYATAELDQVLADYYQMFPLHPKKNKPKPPKLVVSDHSKAYPEIKGLEKTVINAGYDLKVIAETLTIELTHLLQWNPKIKNILKETGRSALYLPADLMMNFQVNKSSILINSLLKLKNTKK